MSDIVYLYGFAAGSNASPPRALSGVHGAPVSVLDIDGVRPVVSMLPDSEFSPALIDSRIQDLNWVGARGLEHERVVAWFVDNAEILPVSLFTMYSSEHALREDVRTRAAALEGVMARLKDAREWDLKVSYDETVLARNAASVIDSIREIDAEIAAAAPGKKFLLEKKRRDVLKREITTAARMRARGLLDELAAHAKEVVTLPMPRSDDAAVVLNAALLVTKAQEAALREASAASIQKLQDVGIHASLTGPWAPYRFTEVK